VTTVEGYMCGTVFSLGNASLDHQCSAPSTCFRAMSRASGYIRSLIELTWPRRIYVLCPERDKLRSLPRTPTPHGSPPAYAGALGAAEALLPFAAFVRPRRHTRGHYCGRCNLPATMRQQGRGLRSALENRWYSAVATAASYLFLACIESSYITGSLIHVDGGVVAI